MKTNSQKPSSAAYCSAWMLIETCIVISIIGLIVALIWSAQYKESVQMPAAFSAWEKQTGNEKHLTYMEWRSLMRANEKQNDAMLIFVPH